MALGHISLLRNHVATLGSLGGFFTSGFVCYFSLAFGGLQTTARFQTFFSNSLVSIISRNFVSVLPSIMF